MRHRHLVVGAGFIRPTIDDIVSLGLWQDWIDFCETIGSYPSLLDSVERISLAHIHDPNAQGYDFWLKYVLNRRYA